jgi:hypothetical protein
MIITYVALAVLGLLGVAAAMIVGYMISLFWRWPR